MSRVTNLPLVSSACEAVSSAYTSTKDSVPLLKGVMDAAESGVRTLGAAASSGSKPLLDMMEPQSKVPPSRSHMMPSAARIGHESTFWISATKMLFWSYICCLWGHSLDSWGTCIVCSDLSSISVMVVSISSSFWISTLWCCTALWFEWHWLHLSYSLAVSFGVSFSVATVNQYAMKGLDKMEEKLPILHQPADQVTQKPRTCC